MGKFDGWLLASDFDGTLIGDNGAISKENIEAIQYFVGEGGRFAGATGRTEVIVRPFMAGLPVDTPWILYNGGAIYDFVWQTFKWRGKLDRSVVEPFAAEVIRRFPEANVQVHTGGLYHETNPADPVDREVIHEKQEYIRCPLEKTPEGWIKVLFGCDDIEVLRAIEAAYKASPVFEVAHNTYSGSRYYELTPKGTSKGSALRELKSLLHPAPHTVVAIGDYLNDLEMLQEADIAAAPQNARPELLEIAQIVTRHHSQSAVADLIHQLDSGNYSAKR